MRVRGQVVLPAPDGPVVVGHPLTGMRQRVLLARCAAELHDLRHYFASLLIASGADIKTVQARLRHATAQTTLDIYGHLWPDADESTRAAVGAVIADRLGSAADAPRTDKPAR
jgi:integrase